MSVSWTTEQQRVIDLRDRNILVSAAAGSGKTAVLVERIITMLTKGENPMDVDRLLIVTFTEAAAAEMKERIRTAIEKALEQDPDNEHLKQQATLIHNARITTIHSFCLSVIKDHFHAISLDPGFRIGEEGELKLLRHDVLEEVLEEHYAEGRQEFLDFTSAYSTGKSDKKIEELVSKIYDYSRSYPDADGWLVSCVQAYGAETLEELENSAYIKLIVKNIKQYLEDAEKLVHQGISICQEADGPAVYESVLLKDVEIIDTLQSSQSYCELSQKMKDVKWARLKVNKDQTVSEEKIAQVKAIREDVKGLVKDMKSQYFYDTPEGLLEDMQRCKPMAEELTHLVRAFASAFEEKKRAGNVIDFSDMEQYALRILTEKEGETFVSSAVAKEYQEQFAEIMIDEYQDSNLIQETILTSISTVSEGRYNIFMVGDVKQSIYRFRLSRPELFMEKFDAYSTEDSVTQRIDLHKNFRSRAEVLDSVNYIFRQIMTRSLGGITYDAEAALYVGASYKDGAENETEVLVIDKDMDAWMPEGERLEKPTERELEARAIAGRIKELRQSAQVTDKRTGELRPVRYSDIVILTRSIKGFADVFTEVLNAEGIPAYAGTREGYFSTQEIGVLLNYLRVLDNRRQDIPLAAVLHSAIGNLDETELAVIKSAYKEVPFHEAVMKYRAEGEEKEIREKLELCMGTMEGLKEIVPYTPMHELLFQILRDTGYGDYVSMLPGGLQRKANLEMLSEKARAFESSGYKGLFHFIRYMEELQKYNVDYGEANVEDEQSDTVRVMTIHKSKGLEFPIVFVAGMGKRFNMQDARSSVVLHSGLGIGMDAVHLEMRTKSPTLVKKAIQKEEALDSLGEELRVLYVALTRAKEKLIITGTVSEPEKVLAAYDIIRSRKEQELSFQQLSKAATYWDFLLPAMIRLTDEIPMEVRVLHVEDIIHGEVKEEVKERMTKAVLRNWDTNKIYEPEVKEFLKEQFAYSYPYEESKQRKLKFTVSELKKRIYIEENLKEEATEAGEFLYEEPEVVPLLPKFLQEEEELGGAARGTAYHRILELLDFTKSYTAEDGKEHKTCAILEKEIEKFCESGRLTKEMSSCIKVEDLKRFFESSCAKRMQASAGTGGLRREQPFVLGIPSQDVYPDDMSGEKVLVQGIIDVYFEEPDGLVVLDYKTDQIFSENILVEKYHGQLDYYARALEQLTGKKVKEKIIYSFTLGKEIMLP